MDSLPKIDISSIPFSRYGAYLSLTRDARDGTLVVHNVRRRFGEDDAFALTIAGVDPNALQVEAWPHKAVITAGNGHMDVYIRDSRTMAFDSYGLDFSLAQLCKRGYGVREADGSFKMIAVDHRIFSLLVLQQGSGALDGPYLATGDHAWADAPVNAGGRLAVRCEDGRALLALNMSIVEPLTLALPIQPQLEQSQALAQWERFLDKLPRKTWGDARIDAFACLTWYNLWSSFVEADDVYHYDTMLMSKKYMSSVWSWDHCFNALAMADTDADAALHQFFAPFELQSAIGSLPDMINPNQEVVWGVTKPPIHGWCFQKLMERMELSVPTLERAYRQLESWTDWWMRYRDSDADGIPEYPMGNDSGWDNATVFDNGYFIESPDLSAFLVLQMYTLERIAIKLGRSEQADVWSKRAEPLLTALYAHSWDGRRFIAKQSRTHASQEGARSLLLQMPIVLGELLDGDKAEAIALALREEHLTRYGLSTEAYGSERYVADGYWRGPIWAPPTYLIVDGLRRAGYTELAREIAVRYVRMSCETAKGNYENFDALTGKGLRAPGYTWSASVFMLLYWEYAKPESETAL